MDAEYVKIERTRGGWQLIFQKLYQIAKANAGPQMIAKKPVNMTRNRYRDVLPIDSTRVTLEDPDNDYINANFVKNDDVGRRYILCQGPLPQTCAHFWQMTWEQNTSGIIMLNKTVERGMNKCYQYWPQPSEPPMEELGRFRVEYLSHDDESSYRLSRLRLENTETNESREILHFHYTKWPDFGVPQNPEVFLEFLYAVRSSGVLDPEKGPSVVHCSAGIGRSGTFCIVDTLLAKLEQTRELSSVDLQATLLEMRQQRLGLVQTADQLRFSYIAILQGALNDLELEPSGYAFEDEDDDDEGSAEEEDEEIEESDSDELEEEEDARMERKFPHLTSRGSNASEGPRYDVDEPPPLPPRPLETLRPPDDLVSEEEDSDEISEASPSPSPSSTSSPPPLPPTSAPPGPPISPFEREDDTSDIKMESNLAHTQSRTFGELDSENSGDEKEEFGFQVSPPAKDATRNDFMTGQPEPLLNGEVEVLEESGSEDEAELENIVNPPPIPPRSHSLSPSPISNNNLGDLGAGLGDIYDASGPFLLEGRGGEKAAPPQQRLANGIAANGEDAGPSSLPPPLPAKMGRRRSSGPKLQEIAEEEQMLINELDMLEKIVDSKEKSEPTPPPSPPTPPLPSKVSDASRTESVMSEKQAKLKQLRDEKKARIDQKVKDIKEAMRKNETGDFESDWAIPWLLVGFVVMLGYCAYYIIQ